MAVGAAAVIAAGIALWLATRRPLSDGEVALVGTWRAQMEAPGLAPVEYEFRPDRTFTEAGVTPARGTWWREGDTLVVRYPRGGESPWWDVLGSRRPVRVVLTLAPDGPGRFRYDGVLEVGGRPPGQLAAATLIRVAPAAGAAGGGR